ncbi:MAG: hypothetical protein R2681_04085 [Pyrinomonadaceae bacterium]
MRYHDNVPGIDRQRIDQALADIEKYGDRFHGETVRFIRDTDLVIYLDLASKVGGSGSVQLDDQSAARSAVKKGGLEVFDAAGFVRLNIARETIDTGGQRGIEGTFVHEGKHARDFALMLSTFSKGVEEKIFNPTAFQREYSAHLTAALYLMRRGGEYADEGVALGLLYEKGKKHCVNIKGIRARLRKNYRLTAETPGGLLNECSRPKIRSPRKKIFGIF